MCGMPPSVHCSAIKRKGDDMAKGQQKTNKESKKPKKDTSPPKAPSGGEPVRPTQTTTVIPRGKKPV